MANLSVIFNAVDNISKKLTEIGTQANRAGDTFRDIETSADSAFDAVANDAEELEQSIQSIAQSMADGFVDSFYDMADAAGLSADETRAAFEELPDFFRGLGDGLEEAINETGDAAGHAGEEAENLGKKFKKAGEDGKGSGEQMKGALEDVQSFLAAAGIVAGLKKIADAFAECAAQAEQVETAYAKLETIAGGGAMDSLKGQIAALSNETGIAAADLADVAYNAISAGTAVEESVTMASTASKLATAGFTDTSSALGVLTTAINAYGDSAGTATEIADSLITVQNLGVTTVAELSANMGKAIATASAYNVGLDNLESSYISITKAGINTAEGTTYIASMLKELGSAGTDVATILEEETGQSFAELMADGNSLADVLNILYNSVGQNSTALMNLWSSAEAGKASNAIISQGLEQFNDNLVQLGESAGSTEKAYATMADTTEFAHNRMKNSFANMQVSIGNALNPMLENIYNIGSAIGDTIGGIAEKAPWLVGIITGLASGIGALIATITGVIVVTKLWTAAKAALTAAMATETAAMALQVGIIGAIAVAVGVAAAAILSAADSEEEMTASTAEMQNQLAETTTQYERACAVMGENSEAAIALKADMEYLSEEIENSGQTLQEFYDDLNNVVDSHYKITDSFHGVQDEIEKNKIVSDDLIRKLRELSKDTDSTTNSQGKMEAIVGRLNQMYPELGISIDDVTNNLDGLAKKIDEVNNASMLAEKQAAEQAYSDLLAEQTELLEKRAEAEANLNRAREKYNNQNIFSGTWNELWGSGAAEGYDDALAAYNSINAAIEDNQKALEETGDILDEYSAKVTGTSEETIDAFNASQIAIEENREAVEELAKEYQQAYDAALTSIEGQWKLWEQADEVTESSIEDMKTAMQSQMTYWQEYADNLENLQSRNIAGLDDLVASFDDGSVESAGYLAAMADASDTELKEMVASFESLQAAQKNTADDMAELETDFDARMQEIEEDFTSTIERMNMEDEARTAAQRTIQAYIDGIKSMQATAETAAGNVASGVANKLSASGGSNSPAGHASGTIDSEPVYFAGEQGPELIVSGGHDIVFPANETNRIINAVNNYNQTLTDESARSSGSYALTSSSGEAGSVNSSKMITIDLKGSGMIQADKNVDIESLWGNAEEAIKNIFMSLISQEMFEGSERAYGG